MRSKIFDYALGAFLALGFLLLVGWVNYRHLTETDTGINAGVLRNTVTGTAIHMTERGVMNQVTFLIVVDADGYDAGTGPEDVEGYDHYRPDSSASFTVQCQASDNGTTWFWIQECTGGASKTCSRRTWTYTLSGGETHFVLNLPSNYERVRCVFDDSNNGSGMIDVTGYMGQQ